jgi:hypothetical protein
MFEPIVSLSWPGRVTISRKTYQQNKDEFACECCREIEERNRVILKMYLLTWYFRLI